MVGSKPKGLMHYLSPNLTAMLRIQFMGKISITAFSMNAFLKYAQPDTLIKKGITIYLSEIGEMEWKSMLATHVVLDLPVVEPLDVVYIPAGWIDPSGLLQGRTSQRCVGLCL